MPTYEYLCHACGHQFEKFQSITAEAIKECPVCGENKVVRLLTGGVGLIFKGSGFYITDYKKKDSASKSESEAEAKPKPSSEKKEKKDSDHK